MWTLDFPGQISPWRISRASKTANRSSMLQDMRLCEPRYLLSDVVCRKMRQSLAREKQKLWEIKKSWPQDRKQQRLWLFLAWVRLKWNTTRCTFTGRVQATSCCWRWMWSWCINYNLERWGFSPVFSFISLPPSTTSFQDWQKKPLKKTCSFLSQCLQIHMLKSPTLLQ